jgi:hypothetical protein
MCQRPLDNTVDVTEPHVRSIDSAIFSNLNSANVGGRSFLECTGMRGRHMQNSDVDGIVISGHRYTSLLDAIREKPSSGSSRPRDDPRGLQQSFLGPYPRASPRAGWAPPEHRARNREGWPSLTRTGAL